MAGLTCQETRKGGSGGGLTPATVYALCTSLPSSTFQVHCARSEQQISDI